MSQTMTGTSARTGLTMTLQASIHARWGHRVDGLIHTHAWKVSAVIEGHAECDKVFPADDLEQLLTDVVAPWQGKYLTHEDIGTWKGFVPLVWDHEPTVEEIVRRIFSAVDDVIARHDGVSLREVALEEASEFDRCRVVTLRRP
jgi:6-pyruvoyl-tetrahydropterin synthase